MSILGTVIGASLVGGTVYGAVKRTTGGRRPTGRKGRAGKTRPARARATGRLGKAARQVRSVLATGNSAPAAKTARAGKPKGRSPVKVLTEPGPLVTGLRSAGRSAGQRLRLLATPRVSTHVRCDRCPGRPRLAAGDYRQHYLDNHAPKPAAPSPATGRATVTQPARPAPAAGPRPTVAARPTASAPTRGVAMHDAVTAFGNAVRSLLDHLHFTNDVEYRQGMAKVAADLSLLPTALSNLAERLVVEYDIDPSALVDLHRAGELLYDVARQVHAAPLGIDRVYRDKSVLELAENGVRIPKRVFFQR